MIIRAGTCVPAFAGQKKVAMKYSPSLACADQLNLERDVRELMACRMDMMHIDIMDGHYVPNLSLNPQVCQDLKSRIPSLELDVHLMVTNPMDYIERLAAMSVDWFTFQMSATNFLHRTISMIKKAGMKAGIAVNPGESLTLLEPVIDMVDMILLMAIEPGFSGQPFIHSTIDRISQLSNLRKSANLRFVINVDGGIDAWAGRGCVSAGADILVLGMFACFNQPEGISASFRKFSSQVEG